MKKRVFKTFLIVIIIISLITGLSIIGIKYAAAKYREYKKEQIQKQLESQILDGSSAAPLTISVDYSKQTAKGSPLIFGGNHAPNVEHQDAWNKIAEVGVTSIRKDLFIDKALPNNISINDYLKNKNGAADTENWNWNEINKIKDIFSNAKKRNFKTIGILCYNPAWLTFSKTPYGVPISWTVYEDIVKKIYKIHRNNLDYIEIWNEPDWNIFFNTKNSGLSPEEAYSILYYHATKAIREVDSSFNDGKTIPIGGPANSDVYHTSVLETLLKSKRINTESNLNYISYHNYETKYNVKEPSWTYYKTVLKKYNLQNKNVMITEWNYDSEGYQKPNKYNTGNDAVIYTANKFIDFLKMGLYGAFYHILEPIAINKPKGGEGYFGFYSWKNGKAELLPQAKTWRILSKSMGLGTGESKIISTQNSAELNSTGFINSTGEEGVAFVNDSEEKRVVELKLRNIREVNRVKVEVYIASADENGGKVVQSDIVDTLDNILQYRLTAPPQSVVGIKIIPESQWYDFIDNLIEKQE